jgi:hypothetical protein
MLTYNAKFKRLYVYDLNLDFYQFSFDLNCMPDLHLRVVDCRNGKLLFYDPVKFCLCYSDV